MKVTIYGAGAVGGLVAARLAQSGCDVSVVARGTTLAAIVADGLRLITETGLYNAEMAANVEKMNEKFVRFDESARTADALESSLKRSGSLTHLLRCQTRSNREYYKALATLLALRKAPRAAPKASKNTSEIAETNPAPPPETLQTRDNQVTPASGTRQSPASPLAQTVTPQAPHPIFPRLMQWWLITTWPLAA